MNLRMNEENARVLFAAIVVWAIAVAGAAAEGVFGKFDAKSVATFAVSVALYAFAAYRIDRGLHAFIQGLPRGAIVAGALLSLGAFAAASAGHLRALAVFAAPLAAVACAAAVEKLATRPTKARAKSPGVSRAAT
ncbi:MAG TPA: hypothetical protein VKR38_14635 [Usitatibacter sp.]|nr:hypothetical protein [Usitatibacter sp.]